MRRSYLMSLLVLATTLACNAKNEKPSAQDNVSAREAAEPRSDIIYDRGTLTEIMEQRQLHAQKTIKVAKTDPSFAENYAKALGGTAAEVELIVFAPNDGSVDGKGLALVGGAAGGSPKSRTPRQASARSGASPELNESSDSDFEPTDAQTRTATRIGVLLMGVNLPRIQHGENFEIDLVGGARMLGAKVAGALPRTATAEERTNAEGSVTPDDIATFLKVLGIKRFGKNPTAADIAAEAARARSEAIAAARDRDDGDDSEVSDMMRVYRAEENARAVRSHFGRAAAAQGRGERRAARGPLPDETREEWLDRMAQEPGMGMAVALQREFYQFLTTLGQATVAGAAVGGSIGASTAGFSGVLPGTVGGAVCGAGGYCIYASRHLIRAIWNQ